MLEKIRKQSRALFHVTGDRKVISGMKSDIVKTLVFNFINNSKVRVLTARAKRDKSVWLFGAWMGERFADNSRFLFQYLHENGQLYGIKKVVWITKSLEIQKLLNSMGYESYIIGSKESDYYHLKAGVHVICNSVYKDIDSSLSAGAIKIQLWHGVGIKACGRLNRGRDNWLHKIMDTLVWPYYDPGNWGKSFFLAPSEENKRVAVLDFGYSENRVIEGINPRLCPCVKYLDDERNIIEFLIRERAEGKKIVLYLPTFRKGDAKYIEPYELSDFSGFLKSNNIRWIQKRHKADSKTTELKFSCDEIMELDRDFDVNVLYDYIDLVVTDYSSASSDAIFKGVRTLEYCPDINEYLSNERSFVAEFEKYHAEKMISEPEDILNELYRRLFTQLSQDEQEKYSIARKFLFGNSIGDYECLMRSLMLITGEK